MYRITKEDGSYIGITESVRYIKIGSNGCFVQTDKNHAIGVAFKNTPYNLSGYNNIAGADSVIISEVDVGSLIEELIAENESLRAQIAASDEAVIEIYESLNLGS